MAQQSLPTLLIFVEEDHHHHQVACRGRTDHQRTDETLLIAQIEEGIPLMREAIGFDAVADPVGNIILQPALLNVEHLVEEGRDVETHTVPGIGRDTRLDLLFRQPFLVGEGELQFVAVEGRLGRAQDRQHLFRLHLADARQIVEHLFLFVFQLILIRDVLPFATTANTKVLAERFHTVRRVAVEMHGLALCIAVFLASELDIHHITRCHKRNEDHHVVHFGDRFSFSGYICDSYLLQKRQRFLVSSQCYYCFCSNYACKGTIISPYLL